MKKNREIRVYHFTKDGKPAEMRVAYDLVFVDGVLRDVFNEYGYSIEKKSECWDYFNRKYNAK